MTTLDLSNHDYSTFNPACLKAAGVTKVIVGCWNLDITLDIVSRSRAIGIDASELYCFMYPGLAWEQREVLNAVEVQARLGGIKIAWPDCESQFTEWSGDLDTEAPGTTISDRISVLRKARLRLTTGGIPKLGTYTGGPWWISKMGNTSEFSHDPLWLAHYGLNNPNNPQPPIKSVHFGGWTSVYRHQYSSTIVVCGRVRDHNYDLVQEVKVDLLTYQRLLVAIFGDSSERNLSWEEQVSNAQYRVDRRVDKEDPIGSGLIMPLAQFVFSPKQISGEVTLE